MVVLADVVKLGVELGVPDATVNKAFTVPLEKISCAPAAKLSLTALTSACLLLKKRENRVSRIALGADCIRAKPKGSHTRNMIAAAPHALTRTVIFF